MKYKAHLIVFAILLCFNSVDGQEKSKKEIKASQKLSKQKEIESLLLTKTFEFEANFVNPRGGRSINIQGERYGIVFSPELVDSYLPFFGRAYNIGYNGDSGLKFKGTPENYKIEKKKKYNLITTTVKGDNDTFTLVLSVYSEGSALLTVSSNQRESISYSGVIVKPKSTK